MTIIPYLVATLQVGAGLVYLVHQEWRLSIIWLSVSVASFATAGLRS